MPVVESCQLGNISVAPLLPQQVHRADRQSLTLDASAPHRITNGASAMGAQWWQCGQLLQ
jgi:hypothetical protein